LTTVKEVSMSFEEGFSTIAAAGAEWVPWLLAVLAGLVAAVALERAIVLLRTRVDLVHLRGDLGRALGQGDLFAARMCVVRSRSIEAHVVCAGFAALPRGIASAEDRLASEARMTRLSLERGIAVLGGVASSAPFVGLLGTVLRLVVVFRTASFGQPMVDVGAALAASAVGLLVAAAAAALFVYFRRRIDSRIVGAEALGRYMLSFFKDERRIVVNEAA
jgi:biopolymer transport protein ExbB/TolQ